MKEEENNDKDKDKDKDEDVIVEKSFSEIYDLHNNCCFIAIRSDWIFYVFR